MKDQLALLEELQRHDAKLLDVERQLHALPERLRTMQQDLAQITALVEREKSQIAETQRWKGEQDLGLKDAEAAIAKARSKVQQSRGGKDFAAGQREVEAMRKQSEDKEAELVHLLETLEVSKQRLAAREAEVGLLADRVKSEEQLIKSQLDELSTTASALRGDRDEVANKLKADVIRKYNVIRGKRGRAVVAVRRGICTGCNMAIPPQLFNTLQRMNSIETCPTCTRIIYWDTISQEAELERAEATP